MDFGRGFSYVRQDPNWLVKTVLGSVISLVPILNFAATGYAMDVLRNIHNGQETPLPEWGENFGDRLVRGFIGTIIQFIYALPIVLLGCGLAIVTSVGASSLGENGAAGLGLFGLCLVPIFIVATFGLSILGMIGQARYAISNDFGQALRVGEVVAEFRQNLGRWLGLIGMAIVLSLAATVGFAITCGLGILLAFYLTLVTYHWIAQAHRQSIQSPSQSTQLL